MRDFHRIGSVTPTDRPTSVNHFCEIEVLVAFLCCHLTFLIIVMVHV